MKEVRTLVSLPRHVEAPSVEEYFPASHTSQVDSAVAPSVKLYFPAPQAFCCSYIRYFRILKLRVRTLVNLPWHEASLIAPVATLNFPLPQSKHEASLVAPVNVLYFPSPQSTHAVAPVDELYFPSWQYTHVASLVAPVDALYFPASHSSQVDSVVAPSVEE